MMARMGWRQTADFAALRNARRGRFIVVVLAVAGSFCGLVFSRLSADRLSADGNADLRALFGGLSAVGFLAIGLQLTLVGALGRQTIGERLLPARLEVRFYLLSVVVALFAGIGASIFVGADTTYRIQVGLSVTVAVVAMLASALARAELLNGERWLQVGCVLAIGPVVRLLAGALLLSAAHPSRNLLPVVLSECISATLAFVLRPRRQALQRQKIPGRDLAVGGLASLGLLASLAALSVGLRARLGSAAAVFNDSTTLGRVIVFLPLTVSVLYLPALARSPLGSKALHRAYLGALGWTAALAGVAGGAILIAPHRIATVVLGPDNAASVTVVRILAVSWMLISVAIVPMLQYVAHGSRLALLSWGPAVIIGVGQLAARTPNQLAVVALASSTVLFVLVSVPALLRVQPVLHARRATIVTSATAPYGSMTLVIPCYNPGPTVQVTIRDATTHLRSIGIQPTIIAVTDGSTDGSDALIDDLDMEHLVHIRHDHNRGKGAALRTGFASATTDIVGFIDADGDLAPTLLERMLTAQQQYQADIVFGSKLHPESTIEASRLRRVYSAGYQHLIRMLFQLDVRDTQTGIKVIHRRVLDAVLPALQEDGFALDLELFIAARANGFTNYVEVPVILQRQAGSTISIRSVAAMIRQTLRLFWRAKVKLDYLRSSNTAAASILDAPAGAPVSGVEHSV